jgi:hypothetical protein
VARVPDFQVETMGRGADGTALDAVADLRFLEAA